MPIYWQLMPPFSKVPILSWWYLIIFYLYLYLRGGQRPALRPSIRYLIIIRQDLQRCHSSIFYLLLLQNKKVYHDKQKTDKHTVSNEAWCVRLFMTICCGWRGYGATRWREESTLNLLRIGPTRSSATLWVQADKLLLSSAFATVLAERLPGAWK